MNLILLFVFLLTLAGCATPYQARGSMGGLSHTRVAPDRFIVRANGNGFSNLSRMQDFALLRAAELTLASGYSHFTIAGARSGVSTENLPPQPVITTTTATARTVGRTTNVQAQSVTQPPIGPTQAHFPGAELSIQCAHAPGPTTHDAAFLVRELRAKYRLPPAN